MLEVGLQCRNLSAYGQAPSRPRLQNTHLVGFNVLRRCERERAFRPVLAFQCPGSNDLGLGLARVNVKRYLSCFCKSDNECWHLQPPDEMPVRSLSKHTRQTKIISLLMTESDDAVAMVMVVEKDTEFSVAQVWVKALDNPMSNWTNPSIVLDTIM